MQLYIAGKEVELEASGLVLYNYTRESLDNPTIVKNSYSQEVSIKATPKNNKVFGDWFKVDRSVADSEQFLSGRYFNALRKVQFVVYSDRGEVIQSGYCKLESVSRKGNEIAEYSVSLYGGLGEFFYGLSYTEEGEEMSLADLRYPYDNQGQASYFEPRKYSEKLSKEFVGNCWEALEQGDTADLWGIFNFAPSYEDAVDGFSADKAVYKPSGVAAGQLPNIYVSKTEEGVAYGPQEDANGYVLLEFGGEHTEWETQDLRVYNQRPVLKVLAFIEALEKRSNEWKFVCDSSCRGLFTDLWITLNRIDREETDVRKFFTWDVFFEGVGTPAEYLLGLAKVFGLVFRTDDGAKTVTMMSRDAYYQGGQFVDLSERVSWGDESSIVPLVAGSKYYEMSIEQSGENAKAYKEKYGREYGSQTIDTGYEFDAETTELLDGCVLRGAPMVCRRSLDYRVMGGTADDQGSYDNYLLKFAFSDSVSWILYGSKSGEEMTLDCEPAQGWFAPFLYSANYYDFLPKVEFGEDEGAGVLLYFGGMVETPVSKTAGRVIAQVEFHLSEDTDEMLALNSGSPCWDVSPRSGVQVIEKIPRFERWTRNESGIVDKTLDFGEYREVYIPDLQIIEERGLYPRRWQAYLADEFDKDTKEITVKVDLSGMRVNEDLLRNRYWFEGCVWVLNEIRNYDMSGEGLTECSFIRVKEWKNYTNGQKD